MITGDEVLAKLKKLRTQLRREATMYCKKVGSDQTHYEGMNKGLWLAYESSANKIQQLINQIQEK